MQLVRFTLGVAVMLTLWTVAVYLGNHGYRVSVALVVACVAVAWLIWYPLMGLCCGVVLALRDAWKYHHGKVK